MLSPAYIALAAVIMLGGSTVFGTVGFGLGLSASPFLLLVLEPQTVVILVNAAGLFLSTMIFWRARKEVPIRQVLPIATAGIAGVPAGVTVLALANPTALRVFIAVLIMAVAVFVALGARRSGPQHRLAGPVVGLMTGAFINSTGIGGPLIALYFLARYRSPTAVRGSLALYLLSIKSTGFVGYAAAGLITVERLWLGAAVVPSVLLGYVVAGHLLRRMDEPIFRRVVLTIIVAASSLVLVREIVRLATG